MVGVYVVVPRRIADGTGRRNAYRGALFDEESILAPLQGSWIGEAKTEGLFRFAQSCAAEADIIRPRNLR